MFDHAYALSNVLPCAQMPNEAVDSPEGTRVPDGNPPNGNNLNFV